MGQSDEEQDVCGNQPDCIFRRFYLSRNICDDCLEIHKERRSDNTDDDEKFPSCIEQSLQIISTETFY